MSKALGEFDNPMAINLRLSSMGPASDYRAALGEWLVAQGAQHQCSKQRHLSGLSAAEPRQGRRLGRYQKLHELASGKSEENCCMTVGQPAPKRSGIWSQVPCPLQEGVKRLLMHTLAVLEIIVKHHGG